MRTFESVSSQGANAHRTYVKSIVLATKPVEEEVPVHLRLDQDQVNEQHDEVMLDVFVGKPLAARTLGEPDAFAQRPVIRLAVCRVQLVDRIATLNTYGHFGGEGRARQGSRHAFATSRVPRTDGVKNALDCNCQIALET